MVSGPKPTLSYRSMKSARQVFQQLKHQLCYWFCSNSEYRFVNRTFLLPLWLAPPMHPRFINRVFFLYSSLSRVGVHMYMSYIRNHSQVPKCLLLSLFSSVSTNIKLGVVLALKDLRHWKRIIRGTDGIIPNFGLLEQSSLNFFATGREKEIIFLFSSALLSRSSLQTDIRSSRVEIDFQFVSFCELV